jgi:hypothetical protein
LPMPQVKYMQSKSSKRRNLILGQSLRIGRLLDLRTNNESHRTGGG